MQATLFARVAQLVFLWLSLAAAPVGHRSDAAPAQDAATWHVVHPERGAIVRYVTLPGTVRPLQQATLYAKVAGYLKSIAVDKGDSVKEGDLLAEIEAPELIAELARFKAEVEVAKNEHERMRDALAKAPDLIMPLDLVKAKGRYEVAKANWDRIQTLLGFTRITAPFPGTVTMRYVDLGAFIPAATSGSAAQTAAIVTLMNFSVVRVQIGVPEAEASLVTRGQPVQIRVEGLPGRRFEGTITRFAYALDDTAKTMLAEAELPNPSLELRPGMYATVNIGLQRKEDVLWLPLEAVTSDKAGSFVFTVVQGKAKKLPVQTGFKEANKLEIVSGLAGPEPILVTGGRPLNDGQPVTIVEGK